MPISPHHAEMTVTFFRFNPDHREHVLEDVVAGALANMAPGKHVPRNLLVQVGAVLPRCTLCGRVQAALLRQAS